VLYGKANPVDAADTLGPYIQGVHAKDGLYPTDPAKLGQEVPIGQGKVDFHKVRAALDDIGYRGWLQIEGAVPDGKPMLESYQANCKFMRGILA